LPITRTIGTSTLKKIFS